MKSIFYILLFTLNYHSYLAAFNSKPNEYSKTNNYINSTENYKGLIKCRGDSDILLVEIPYSKYYNNYDISIRLNFNQKMENFDFLLRVYEADNILEKHSISYDSIQRKAQIQLVGLINNEDNPDKIKLYLYNPKKYSNLVLSYEIELYKELLTYKQVIFLLFAIAFFIAIYTLKTRNNFENMALVIERMTDENVSDVKKWWNPLLLTANLLVLILIVDELGAVFEEWGVNIKYIDSFQKILALPVFSYCYFLSNLIILIPATYSSMRSMLTSRIKLNCESYRYIINFSFGASIFLTSLILALNSIQAFQSNEYGITTGVFILSPSLMIVLLTIGILLIAVYNSFKLLSTYAIDYERFNISKERWKVISSLVIFFLCFAQTMITKVIVLFSLFNWFKKKFIIYLKVLVPHIEVSNKSFETRLGDADLSKQIEYGSFLFLISTAFPLLLLWQIESGPFPPTSSAYPYGITLSFIYSSYMIIYYWIMGTKSKKAVLLILWVIFTILVVDLLPSIYPELFMPAKDPPGYTIISFFGEIGQAQWFVPLLLYVHLIVFLGFYLALKEPEAFNALRNNNFSRYLSIRNYVFSYMLLPFILLSMVFVIFHYILFSSMLLTMMIEFDFMLLLVFFILLIMITGIYFLLVELFIRRLNYPVYDRFYKVGGNSLIQHLSSRIYFFKIAGRWRNPSYRFHLKNYKIRMFLLITTYFIISTIIITNLSKSEFSINNKVDLNDGYKLLSYQKGIASIGLKSIVYIKKQNLKIGWKRIYDRSEFINRAYKLNDDMLVVLVQKFKISRGSTKANWTLNCISTKRGEVLWSIPINWKKFGSLENLRIHQIDDSNFLLAGKSYEAIIKSRTGSISIDIPSNYNIYEENNNIRLSWSDKKMIYFFMNGQLQSMEKNECTSAYAFSKGILISNHNSILWESKHGSLKEVSYLSSGERIEMCINAGNYIIISIRSQKETRTLCFNTSDTKVFWQKDNCNIFINKYGEIDYHTSNNSFTFIRLSHHKSNTLVECNDGKYVIIANEDDKVKFNRSNIYLISDRLEFKIISCYTKKELFSDPIILAIKGNASSKSEISNYSVSDFDFFGKQLCFLAKTGLFIGKFSKEY